MWFSRGAQLMSTFRATAYEMLPSVCRDRTAHEPHIGAQVGADCVADERVADVAAGFPQIEVVEVALALHAGGIAMVGRDDTREEPVRPPERKSPSPPIARLCWFMNSRVVKMTLVVDSRYRS